jgi:hypothetical protein
MIVCLFVWLSVCRTYFWNDLLGGAGRRRLFLFFPFQKQNVKHSIAVATSQGEEGSEEGGGSG